MVEVTEPIDRRRVLLAGVIAILGGYLTILAIGGQLIQQLLGFGGPVEFTVLFAAQLVFAVGVSALGYFLVPGPLLRRVIAKIVYIVGIAILVLVLVLRVGGTGGALLGNQFVQATISNVFFMVLLFGALAWLIAVGARPFAYLSLVLAAVIAPVGLLFVLNGVSNGISYIVQLIAVAIAAGVILLISIPRRRHRRTSRSTRSAVRRRLVVRAGRRRAERLDRLEELVRHVGVHEVAERVQPFEGWRADDRAVDQLAAHRELQGGGGEVHGVVGGERPHPIEVLREAAGISA